MSVWHRHGLLSLLLVPILIGFSVQGSLEIIHPIEEGLQPSHHHLTDGPTIDDLARCAGGVHPSHYCAHSNALGHLARLPVAFRSLIHRTSALAAPKSPGVRRALNVFGRGPPVRT